MPLLKRTIVLEINTSLSSPTTMDNEPLSFFRLPLEIRQQIYDHLFFQPRPASPPTKTDSSARHHVLRDVYVSGLKAPMYLSTGHGSMRAITQILGHKSNYCRLARGSTRMVETIYMT
jgi:hypothetical protein